MGFLLRLIANSDKEEDMSFSFPLCLYSTKISLIPSQTKNIGKHISIPVNFRECGSFTRCVQHLPSSTRSTPDEYSHLIVVTRSRQAEKRNCI